MEDRRNTINQSLQKRARAQRLPSLQARSDLTLGNPGNSANSGVAGRRVFVPNLNPKKQKEAEPETKKDQRDSSRRNRKSQIQRERKPFQPKEYVQSYSMFAEGPATASNFDRSEKPSFPLGGGGRGTGGGRDGGHGLRLGGSSSKLGGSEPKKEEFDKSSMKKDKKIHSGFIDDLQEGDMTPIVYPRKEMNLVRPPPSDLLLRGEDDEDFEELGLIQLINPLPVEHSSPGIDTSENDAEGVDFTRLPEGEFAKLQVLDTGEVRLVIGDKNAMVRVLNGTQVDHLMELVRIRTTEEIDTEMEEGVPPQRSGEMHVLGKIENRFVCAANFDSVFKDMSSERESSGQDSDSDLEER